ncbi:MAG TPA: divalent-cation tolerance protein CutA [Solirubrobacterales bacterium]|jgi:periplasmic divalent cation tolerance protein|nr:divalent-cation tolerance protein CutA [Solirubrobacterales bacterium]
MSSFEHLQVQTTAGSEEEAKRIAEALVDERLAACVQIVGPIASRYRWQGKVEEAQEWLCLIKTTSTAYDAVQAAIRAAHSYDEPEIIAIPITLGSSGYLAWVEQNVDSEAGPGRGSA